MNKNFSLLILLNFVVVFVFASDFTIETNHKSNYSVNRNKKIIKTADGTDLLVYIYYPVEKHQTKNYIYTSASFKKEYLEYLKKRIGDSAANLIINAKYNFSTNNIIVDKKFPVVFFSAGLSWSTLEYSFLIHNIVESGKIVIAINTNYTSAYLDFGENNTKTWIACEDKYKCLSELIKSVQSKLRSKDTLFNLINNNVNLKEQIFIGHSLGGAASLLAATGQEDVIASINLDGDMMKSSLEARPNGAILFLNQIPNDYFNSGFEDLKNDSQIGWRYTQMEKNSSDSKYSYYLSIKGMYHSNFQDYALLSKGIIPYEISKNKLGAIEGRLCLDLIAEIVIDFMNQSLNMKNKVETNYPAVMVKKIVVKE